MRVPGQRRLRTLDLRFRQAPQAAVVDCTLFRRAGTTGGGAALELGLGPAPMTEPVPEPAPGPAPEPVPEPVPEPGPEAAGGARGRGRERERERGFESLGSSESFALFKSSWVSVGPLAAAGLAGLPGLPGLAGSKRRNGPLTLTLALGGCSLARGDGDLEAEDVIVGSPVSTGAELPGAGTTARSRWWERKGLQLQAGDRTRTVLILEAPSRRPDYFSTSKCGLVPFRQPKTRRIPAKTQRAANHSRSALRCTPIRTLADRPDATSVEHQQSGLSRRGGRPELMLQDMLPRFICCCGIKEPRPTIGTTLLLTENMFIASSASGSHGVGQRFQVRWRPPASRG